MSHISLDGTWTLGWCDPGEGEDRGWPDGGGPPALIRHSRPPLLPVPSEAASAPTSVPLLSRASAAGRNG